MMNFPLSPFNRPITRTTSADVAQKYNVDPVFNMAYNESPLGPSINVVTAIRETAVSIGSYPPMGDEALRNALAQTWGRGLTAHHFFTGCSGYEAIELLGRAVLQAGDQMIVAPPTFSSAYNKIAALQGAAVIEVPLRQPDFTPNVAAILSAVTPQTRIILLCNPNNPTGTIMPAADMAHLVANLPDNVLLVVDEVYCHFVTAETYPDSVSYVLADKPVVAIHSFSKAYGMAGLRLGYAVAPPRIADYVGGIHRGFHQNAIALAAGVAALEDQDHLQKNVQAVLTGKQWFYAQFDRLGLTYLPSQTNFVVVRMTREATAVAKALLPFGVMVKALSDPGLENCLRVSVSTEAGNQQFIHGLEEILHDQ
jgi:histidinol-phosphate aminotransferase